MLQKTFKTKLIGTLAAIGAISTSLFVAPTVARADNSQFLNDVSEQLVRALLASGFGGYSPTHEPVLDSLYQGRSHYININLRAGTSYGIVGVCDRDCRDLDIALYDERGNLVTSDAQDDDIPAISVTPYRSGRYQVRVDMANCDSGLCYYGLGVFGK